MDTRILSQREHIRRGFTIYVSFLSPCFISRLIPRYFSTSHQKVVLELDFAGSLWGYTELTIVPANSELRTLHLHSRQCTIHSVSVAGHAADFVHHDPLSNINFNSPSEATDCHRHPELKRKLYSALQESDEGELSIAIPSEVVVKPSGQYSSHLVVNDVSTPEPQTPSTQSQSLPEFAPITVHIAYSLRNPVDGFQFILPSDAYPYRVPHAYTTPSSPDSARCWVPCIDSLWERCTWEFEFVVPRYLEEREHTRDEDESADLIPTVVICSGELQEQVAHPNNSNKTIFVFSQPVLTSVQHVAFAAGPFHLYSIPADVIPDDATSTVAQPPMYAFGLPGHESFLQPSTSFLRSAMSFYSTEYGSYPFGSHKLVFVDELPTQRFDSATMSLVTVDLLHGEDSIDQAIETRHTLSHALSCQWTGINIIPKAWSDIWLTNGLALYITGLFLRKLFGNNDYRFRLKKDMQRVAQWDVGVMPPICQPQVLDPPDAATLPFINLKAPLVLHILDRQLGKSGTSLGLSRILPKIFLSALTGELPNNALSTHSFLRMCRRISGVEPRTFAEQWIYGSGCPTFSFSASFNRKKMAVEITMRQESPAFQALENSEINRMLMKPVAFFEGQMTIRIHEADGTPYEHVLDIWQSFKRYEVPFNTKYKRVRRNTKRYLARQAAAQAAAEGDVEAAEAMGMVDMGFGLEIWEKEQERDNWKVADWTEEDENVMSGSTYEWIRMDADFEWIATIKFDQPDFMWVSQLQRDRDVVAQLEAVHALAEKPTPIVSSTLTKTVLVSNYYFRIRCEAALALVQCSIHRLEFLGLFHLFKLFLRYCYDPEDPKQDLFMHKYVPKPNDFSDIPEYFVRKSLVNAISRVRFENGKTPAVVRQFLIDQLRYNDNTANPYSDAFYICTIISSAGCAFVPCAPPERGELLPSDPRNEQSAEDAGLIKQIRAEVERYRSMDRLIPSPHNIVTIATLEFYMMLGLANLIPAQTRVFFPLTREGNYTQVRIAAFDGLFLTKWYTPQIMKYILAVIANDSSRVVRRHVARNACYSLALLVQMGEMKSSLKESESLLIEEDGNLPEKTKDLKKSELDAMIKVLRKDREIGKNEVLREFVMPIALAPGMDHEARWCILKLCDILIRPFEEAPPTAPSFKIHIPSTPVTEIAPPLPTPKAATKAPRIIKSGGPPTKSTKSPLVPLSTPAKLKLPAASRSLDIIPRTPATPIAEPSKRGVVFATPLPSSAKPSKPKGKPTKEVLSKPVLPKAQGGGMSLNDLRASRSALKKLKNNKHATLFLQPVDPIRDHAPNYFEVIKDPMDLSTMGAKLEEGMYKDRFAFQTDFRLMIANAKLYNAPGTYVHNEAIALETFFEKQWTIINKTLQAADKAHLPQPSSVSSQPPRNLPPVPKAAFPSSGTSTPSRAALPHASRTNKPATSTSSPSIVTPRSSSTIPSRTGTPAPEILVSADAPTRPTIKLKMGSKPKATGPALQAPASAVKYKKSKLAEPPVVPIPSIPTSETPPPEYVDDGSHDLLQEVIALENAQRRRPTDKDKDKDKDRDREKDRDKDRDKDKVNGAPKRKKTDLVGDDDILALATPAKKEKPTPPGSFNAISYSDVPASSVASSSSSVVKTAVPPGKPKKERTQESVRLVPSEIVRSTFKGKEKGKEAIHSPSPQPVISKQKKQPAIPTTPINEKKCKELLRVLQKVDGYDIFSRPVDPVLDGCPTYLDEIKHPMDFRTISDRLNDGKYYTMEDFKKDVELVFSNCRKFNPPKTYPVTCADLVEKAFKREWPKAMERRLAWGEKRGLQGIMTTLVKEDVSWLFREPVDPIRLQIPTYFDIIPRRDARDLRTIRQKLDQDKYETVDAFDADMELMIQNAIKFNGAESEVGKITINFQKRYHDLLAAWKSTTTKKRKDGEKGTPQPSKKMKIG